MPAFHKIVFLGFTLLTAGPTYSHPAQNSIKYVTTSLEVAGKVKKSQRFAVSELKAFPSQTLTDLEIVGKHGVTKIQSLKGVLLTDILGKAEIDSKRPGDRKRMYIVATASDGYKAVFSWNELFNTPVGDGILVAYEKNGQEIDAQEGKLVLVSSKDIMNGSRYVKWLQKVQVNMIPDKDNGR